MSIYCTSGLRHVLPAWCQHAAGRPDEHRGETKAQHPALLVSALIAPTVPAPSVPHPVIITRHCVIYPRQHSIKLENGQCKGRILEIAPIAWTWRISSFQCIDLLIQLFNNIVMSSTDCCQHCIFLSEGESVFLCCNVKTSWPDAVFPVPTADPGPSTVSPWTHSLGLAWP